MKTIPFDKNGGPLVAEVTSGFAQPGSYRLQLWEKGLNQVVMKEQGNFINDDDDAYTLPAPVALNDGRIVQAFVILTIIDPPKYFVSLKISQNGQPLGAVDVPEEGPGQTESHTLFFNLIATLQAQADTSVAEAEPSADNSTT